MTEEWQVGRTSVSPLGRRQVVDRELALEEGGGGLVGGAKLAGELTDAFGVSRRGDAGASGGGSLIQTSRSASPRGSAWDSEAATGHTARTAM